MSTSVGEFVFQLVVDAQSGQLTVNQLIKAMGELEIASVGEVAILLELSEKLAGLSDGSVKAAAELNMLSHTSSLGVEKLQRWKAVADAAGWSGDELAASAEGINREIAKLQLGGLPSSLVPLSQFVNLQGVKDVFDVIDRLKRSPEFMNKTRDQQSVLLEQFGMSAKWLAVMHMKQSEIEDVMKHAAVLNKEQIEKFAQLHTELTLIEQTAKQIGIDISTWVSPKLLQFLETTHALMESMHAFAKDHELLLTPEEVSKVEGRVNRSWGNIPEVARPMIWVEEIAAWRQKMKEALFDLAAPGVLEKTGPILQYGPPNVTVHHTTEINMKGEISPDTVKAAHEAARRKERETIDDWTQQLNRSPR